MVYCTKQAVINVAQRTNCELKFGRAYVGVTSPDGTFKNCRGYAKAYQYIYTIGRKQKASAS